MRKPVHRTSGDLMAAFNVLPGTWRSGPSQDPKAWIERPPDGTWRESVMPTRTRLQSVSLRPVGPESFDLGRKPFLPGGPGIVDAVNARLPNT